MLVASTGREAVDKVLENGVDVLILDLRLPLMSSVEVFVELKNLGKTVPTVIVSGYAAEETESIEVLNGLSVIGCLQKPFDPDQLIRAIENLINEPV